MTTSQLLPRTSKAPIHGGTPARRAVVRWAWRLYRREWRRQLLVLALLAVAIAATVVGLGTVTNASVQHADPTFGTANTVVTLPGSDPDLSGDLAALQARFGPVEAIAHQSVPIPGSVANLDLRAQDPHGRYSHVTVRLDAGRYPTGADEIAFSADAAKLFNLKLGDQWSHHGRSFRVVGLVENPLNLLDQFALVAPGQANPPSNVSILMNTNGRGFDSVRLPSHVGMSIGSRSTTGQAAVAAVVLMLSTLGLLFVGLMAVAGFAVMAHRRQRALGMLASLGATDRRLRLVVLANGAAVGMTAALVGAAVGLVGWFAFAPVLQSITKHRVDRLALPWWAVVAAMLLTVVTAIAAAWWPARAITRMPTVAALSGRPEQPRPAHHFAAVGGALLAGGIVLLCFAGPGRAGFIISGTLLTPIGLLLLAPLAIQLLSTIGRRAPIAVTLALRDLARYQARSGAALGAITLAIGIAATIAVSAANAQTSSGPGNLAENQLVMHVNRGDAGEPVPPLTAAQMEAATAAVNQVSATLHASVFELDQTYDAQSSPVSPGPVGPGGGQPKGYMTAVLAEVTQLPHGTEVGKMTTLYAATPDLLKHYGIAESDIGPDVDIISGRSDLGGLKIFDPSTGSNATAGERPDRSDVVTEPTIQLSHRLPAYSSAPGTLLTPHAIQKLGLATLPAGWLVEAGSPLTREQIDLATKAAASAGLYVETRKPEKSLARLQNGATAGGTLLALGVLCMTVGLIRSETSRDLRTLTATGASSHTRRALTGVTAGALALLGAILGTVGAYAALLAWFRSDLSNLQHVPVGDLLVIVVGLPLVAGIGGWLLAGREPAGLARQPLD